MKITKTEDCIYKCEKSFQDLLLALKNRFEKHLELLKFNLDAQINIIDSIGAVCMSPYPRKQSDRKKREIMAAFEMKRDDLRKSNFKVAVSLEDLKQMCSLFDRALANTIDPSLPSQIIEGNNELKPIHYYIEFYADLLKFYQGIHRQFRLLETILYVDDIKSILDYKNHLEPNKTEFDYFEKAM